jgi:hypothetical protein
VLINLKKEVLVMKLTEHVMVRMESDMKKELENIASERGEKLAEVARTFLKEAIQRYHLEKGSDQLQYEVRRAVRDAIDSSVERLAKISAKGTIGANTSMYMLFEMLARDDLDAMAIYENARKKAIQNLKKNDTL